MIRYGIIGPGSIAKKFARDIKLAENSVLVAVASRNIEKAETFCKEFNIPHAFGSYLELVQSDLIDAVYVATPHSYHMEHAILALENGKHVICEKPICVNTRGLNRMIKAAEENKVLLMEAMWTRFLPATQHVKKIIKSKDFGEVKHIDLAFGFEISEEYPDDGRLLNPDLAGGSLLDLGIYPISTMFYLLDKEIKSIDVDCDINSDGIDLDTIIDIVFEDDSTATLHSSIAQDLDDTGIIEFENGYIRMKQFFHCQEMKINKKTVTTPCLGEGFVHQIEAFTKTVEDGLLENEIMSYSATRKVMKFMDDIRLIADIEYPFEKKES